MTSALTAEEKEADDECADGRGALPGDAAR